MRRFSKEELHRIRNDLSVRWVIETLLQLPHKEVEGVFRFLCPACGEFQTAVNPKTNLSRCFRCQLNFNTIELVMREQNVSFVEAVKFLNAFPSCVNEKCAASSETPESKHLQKIALSDMGVAWR